ncbi:MAG: hypothetical protein WCT48_00720 [Candidatus Paceibacterota bacterium]
MVVNEIAKLFHFRLLTGTIVDADPNTLSRKDKNGVTAYNRISVRI